MSHQVQIFIYFRSIIILFVTIALLLHFHDKSLLSLTLHYYSETQECLNNKKYNIISSILQAIGRFGCGMGDKPVEHGKHWITLRPNLGFDRLLKVA